MTEKINGQGFRPVDTAGARRSEAGKGARTGSSTGTAGTAAATGTSSGSGDTISITRSGLLMNQLQEVVQGAPVVDSNRVDAIKDAIASGRYEIDNQKIADKLLQFERSLRS